MKLERVARNIVTALKPTVRDSRRVNVFVNDKFDFSLDLAQVVDYGVKVGQILSEERLEELRHASDFGKLYQRTLEYILMRPRSVKEVRDHLVQKQKNRAYQAKRYADFQAKMLNDSDFKQKVRESRARQKEYRKRTSDFTENNENEYGTKSGARYPTKPAAAIRSEDIERVLETLVAKGYLDDRKFTEYFVENRNTVKGSSRKKLRLELMKKGVDAKIIDEALANSSRDDTEEIQKIIAKKRRRGYDEQKLIQYLMRQGFDYELAKAALRETD